MRPLSWDTTTALQLDFSGQLEGPHSEITEVSYSQTLQQLLAHRYIISTISAHNHKHRAQI